MYLEHYFPSTIKRSSTEFWMRHVLGDVIKMGTPLSHREAFTGDHSAVQHNVDSYTISQITDKYIEHKLLQASPIFSSLMPLVLQNLD